MVNYLIGVDMGTMGTKAIMISENGREISYAYVGYPTTGLVGLRTGLG